MIKRINKEWVEINGDAIKIAKIWKVTVVEEVCDQYEFYLFADKSSRYTYDKRDEAEAARNELIKIVTGEGSDDSN